jgi:hypothetical protein
MESISNLLISRAQFIKCCSPMVTRLAQSFLLHHQCSTCATCRRRAPDVCKRSWLVANLVAPIFDAQSLSSMNTKIWDSSHRGHTTFHDFPSVALMTRPIRSQRTIVGRSRRSRSGWASRVSERIWGGEIGEDGRSWGGMPVEDVRMCRGWACCCDRCGGKGDL